MIYIKSALAGFLAAILGLVAWVGGGLVVALVRLRAQIPEGAGGMGAVSVGISGSGLLLVLLASFILGSAWMYRRLRRRVLS